MTQTVPPASAVVNSSCVLFSSLSEMGFQNGVGLAIGANASPAGAASSHQAMGRAA
jgi:hypothetical protein